MNSIETGSYEFFRDPNTTRLFTTLTMMPKAVREHIRYSGEELVESDLNNCMPYLAIAFFLKAPYKLLSIEANLEEKNPVLYTDQYSAEREELMALLKKYHSGDLTDDIRLYIRLVASGKLYGYFQEKYPQIASDRATLKEMFFYGLFDKVDSKSRLNKALKEDFPNVMRVFDLVKTGFEKTNREGRTRDEQGNALCMILYRAESYMMIDRVARRFYDEHRTAPIFTVHDAILTTPNHKPILDKILKLSLIHI